MSNNDIIRITKIRNVQIENAHDGHLFPLQDIIEIQNRRGDIRIIDLICEKDITDIDYFIVHKSPKTHKENLFIEYEEEVNEE